MKRIAIIGCGPGGAQHLTAAARDAVGRSAALAGAPRLLALFPDFPGTKEPMACPVEPFLDRVAALAEQGTVGLLVTGDPGCFSVAAAALARFGREDCDVIPGIGALQLACARLGLSWEETRLVHAHGGAPALGAKHFATEASVAVFLGGREASGWMARVWAGLAASHDGWLLSDLSLPGETVRPLAAGDTEETFLRPGSLVLLRRKVASGRGRVLFVGAGPGDPELLTVRALRLVETARCCIYAGSLVSPAVIGLLPEGCEKHDSAAMDLPGILKVVRDATGRGLDVVRLHTGDPSIYGAIGEQMRELDRLAIGYEVVPGVSSFLAAAAALPAELTCPEVAQTVILTRAPGRTPVPEAEDLRRLAATSATLCVFLSAGNLSDVCRTISAARGADCPAALVFHASWPDERVLRSTLAELPALAAGIDRTAMLIAGRALAGPSASSKLYDPAFTHGCREGKA